MVLSQTVGKGKLGIFKLRFFTYPTPLRKVFTAFLALPSPIDRDSRHRDGYWFEKFYTTMFGDHEG